MSSLPNAQSLFPSILGPRREIDQALYGVVMEAYVNGVSTRAVDELVQALGIDTGTSRSAASRICPRLDEHVSAFRGRRLDHPGFPFVYLDATYLHVRDDHHVVSKAVVIATGVSQGGLREVLGFDVGDSEDEVLWRGFLTTASRSGGSRACAWSSPTSTPGWWRRCGAAYRARPTSAAG
jgi:transposase-like protein